MIMSDFVQKTNTKTALRTLAAPIDGSSAFDTLVSGIISTNPWGCTSYEQAGATLPAVEKSREAYVAKILYQDGDGKTVGNVSAKAATLAGFEAANTEILGNAALAAAIGGTAVRDTDHETYSATIRAHDPAGEVYYVTISRTSVRISSYSDDSIRTKIETWADGISDLA